MTEQSADAAPPLCALSLSSVPGRPGLLWPPGAARLPPVWHCGRRLLHLHRWLSPQLPLRGLPLPVGALRPAGAAATLLQQPEPGPLPGRWWAAAAPLTVPGRVHRHQLLPGASADPQPGQRVGRRLQEAKCAPQRGHTLLRRAGGVTAGTAAATGTAATTRQLRSASGTPPGGDSAPQLWRLQYYGEWLRELRGGHVLKVEGTFFFSIFFFFWRWKWGNQHVLSPPHHLVFLLLLLFCLIVQVKQSSASVLLLVSHTR